MIDVHYASLTSEGVQHRKNEQMITYPEITRPTVNGREPVLAVPRVFHLPSLERRGGEMKDPERGVEEGWGEVISNGGLWEAAGVVIGGTFPIKSYDIRDRTRVISCKEKCPL